MTTAEIYEAIKASGVGSGQANLDVIVVGADYALPDLGWLAGEFSQKLRLDFDLLGVLTYVDEVNNCNKFGLYAMALASLMNFGTMKKIAATTPGAALQSLGFGFIHYFKQSNFLPVGHEINFTLSPEHKMVYYEPQLQKIVTLSPDEEASIWRVYV